MLKIATKKKQNISIKSRLWSMMYCGCIQRANTIFGMQKNYLDYGSRLIS